MPLEEIKALRFVIAMKRFLQNTNLEPLTFEECVLFNGGEDGDAYHDLARGISYLVHYVKGAWDKFVEDVGDFFDGVQEGWENTRN